MDTDKAKEYITSAQSKLESAMDDLDSALDVLNEDSSSQSILYVEEGDNLQEAIDSVTEDTEIRVYPGTYDSINLTPKNCKIVIRPDTEDLPETRAEPGWTNSLVKIRHNSWAAINIETGAHDYHLVGLEPLPWTDKYIPICRVGTAEETDPTKSPSGIIFDRCLIQATPENGGKRGIEMNCGEIAVLRSYFDNFWCDQDSQGVSSRNGPGPFLIEDNYIAATGENIIFGGNDATNESMIPIMITVRGNTLTKRLEWKDKVGATTKNGFELKAAFSALVENNIIEYSWTSGQTGFLVVLTPRNQDGNNPFVQVKDVEFRNNVVRHASAFVQMLGRDYTNPSQETLSISIHDNLVYNINRDEYPGTGRGFQIIDGPKNVDIYNNTIHQVNANAFLGLEGVNKTQIFMRNNVLYEGEYGIMTGDSSPGKASWDKWVTEDSVLEDNLIARGTERFLEYPGTNTFTEPGEDPLNDDLTLIDKYAHTEAGCDVAEVLRLTGAK